MQFLNGDKNRHVPMETLSFWNSEDLDNEQLSLIFNSSTLKELNIGNCKKITDDGLQKIASSTQIELLNLAGCSQITDKALTFISQLKGLRSLNLSFCSITDVGVSLLKQNRCLQELRLNHCIAITNEGIKSLLQLPLLRKISLNSCPHLNLQSLPLLQRMRSLEELHVGGTSLTDADLAYLPKRLTTLGLGWMPHLTDKAILQIIKLKKLEKLVLNRCVHITDIRLLANLKNLSVLDVRNCPNITHSLSWNRVYR